MSKKKTDSSHIKRDDEKSRLEEYHWNWKGGITPENHAIRQSRCKPCHYRLYSKDGGGNE